MPFYHVAGLSILVRSLHDGFAVVVQEGFDAERVWVALEDQSVTHVSLVPTTLKRLLDARPGRRAPDGFRAVLLGGAAASPALIDRARARGFSVRSTYGLTEAASQLATAEDEGFSGVGRPLDGTRIRIVDENWRSCAAEEAGEIEARGPSIFMGYLDDPSATAKRLRDGWLRTGDVGVLDAEGRLRVLDRRSDLVISGGENVSPAEVERVLLDHPDLSEVVVFGRPDADLGKRVVARVVLRPGAKLDAHALAEFCRPRLAGYKRPRSFEFASELPRNAMGKLVRRALF